MPDGRVPTVIFETLLHEIDNQGGCVLGGVHVVGCRRILTAEKGPRKVVLHGENAKILLIIHWYRISAQAILHPFNWGLSSLEPCESPVILITLSKLRAFIEAADHLASRDHKDLIARQKR